MKATDFAKILKEIIKKEVRSVIREELNEALGKSPQRSKTPTSAHTHKCKDTNTQPHTRALTHTYMHHILSATHTFRSLMTHSYLTARSHIAPALSKLSLTVLVKYKNSSVFKTA